MPTKQARMKLSTFVASLVALLVLVQNTAAESVGVEHTVIQDQASDGPCVCSSDLNSCKCDADEKESDGKMLMATLVGTIGTVIVGGLLLQFAAPGTSTTAPAEKVQVGKGTASQGSSGPDASTGWLLQLTSSRWVASQRFQIYSTVAAVRNALHEIYLILTLRHPRIQAAVGSLRNAPTRGRNLAQSLRNWQLFSFLAFMFNPKQWFPQRTNMRRGYQKPWFTNVGHRG